LGARSGRIRFDQVVRTFALASLRRGFLAFAELHDDDALHVLKTTFIQLKSVNEVLQLIAFHFQRFAERARKIWLLCLRSFRSNRF
jgi:hypothetical protein